MATGSVVAWMAWAMLIVAAAGTVSSTIYLALVLVAARRFQRRPPQAGPTALPAVSILKPLCGSELELEANLASFCEQDYPQFEILFAMRSPDDPALAAAKAALRRHPEVKGSILFSGPPRHQNPKVTSLEAMIAAARHEYIVISDSDVRVDPEFLRRIVAPLSEPRTGLVTCIYRGVPTSSLWSRLEALQMSVEMPSGVLVADMLEGMKFGLGAVLATRKDVLADIGGIGRTGDYYSDDFVLGNLIAGAGYRVELSRYLPEHVLDNESFAHCFRRQLRWNRSTRYSRPKGHLGTGLTFAMPYGVVGAVAGLLLGHPYVGLAMLGFACLRAATQGMVVGGAVVKLRDYLATAALYPVRDALGFAAWAGSYTSGEFEWRGERYRFLPGGKLQRQAAARDEKQKATVAV